jgi:hypothetical protein
MTEFYIPCASLAKLKEGEVVMVNWIPEGTSKAGKIVAFEGGKPIVEMEHNGAKLMIDNRTQIRWNEGLHSKKKRPQ